MCRSAPKRTELFLKLLDTFPIMSFRPQRQRSGGIFPSSDNNQHKVKFATCEDPSTRIRSLGMTGREGGSVMTTQVVFVAFYGDESSPLHCVVSFIRTGYIRDVLRNGTQAVPYGFAERVLHLTWTMWKDGRFLYALF